MRVLMTADAASGVWSYALTLARALHPLGVEITLATMGPPPSDAQREAARAAGIAALHQGDFALEWMDAPWGDVAAAGKWLLELERDLAPDVVHLNSYAHGALAWRAPVVVVAHSCVLSWWHGTQRVAPPETMELYRRAVTRGVHEADLVVAPTLSMMQAVARHYGVPLHSRVVHYACDASRHSPGEKRDVVLAAGRIWDEAKNLAALACAAPHLGWPVEIAGDTVHPEHGVRQLEGVVTLGALEPDAVAARMRTAAIFAHPARYEPFGPAVLEAAHSGCALVLGDIPSLRELWEGAALFVPPDDQLALRRALQRLIGNPSLREEVACAARLRAATFAPEIMARAYRGAYAALVSRHRRASRVATVAPSSRLADRSITCES